MQFIFQDFKDYMYVLSVHTLLQVNSVQILLHKNRRDLIVGRSYITYNPLGISGEKIFLNKKW